MEPKTKSVAPFQPGQRVRGQIAYYDERQDKFFVTKVAYTFSEFKEKNLGNFVAFLYNEHLIIQADCK